MGLLIKEPKILVVDDDRTVADSLVAYLSKLGYQVFPAYSGKEALAKSKQEDYQVVITDLRMPELDGMELLDAMKKMDSNVNVIFLTGYGSVESSVQAVKRGAYDYVTKPTKYKEIELIVHRAIEKYAVLKKMRMFRGLFFFTLVLLAFLSLLTVLSISV